MESTQASCRVLRRPCSYSTASADEIIQLHEHGVTADYARRLQAEGFGTLSVNQLIKMKDHGV